MSANGSNGALFSGMNGEDEVSDFWGVLGGRYRCFPQRLKSGVASRPIPCTKSVQRSTPAAHDINKTYTLYGAHFASFASSLSFFSMLLRTRDRAPTTSSENCGGPKTHA